MWKRVSLCMPCVYTFLHSSWNFQPFVWCYIFLYVSFSSQASIEALFLSVVLYSSGHCALQCSDISSTRSTETQPGDQTHHLLDVINPSAYRQKVIVVFMCVSVCVCYVPCNFKSLNFLMFNERTNGKLHVP